MKSAVQATRRLSTFLGESKLLYSIAGLDKVVAKRQLLASAFTGACGLNVYLSVVGPPLFGLHWTGHVAFMTYGVFIMIRTFVYEGRNISSISLLPDGKTAEFKTSGLFSGKKLIPIKSISARREQDRVYITATYQGFFILNMTQPRVLNRSKDAISIPNESILTQVLSGEEIKGN